MRLLLIPANSHQSLGFRQRKKAHTREVITRTALELFAHDGFAETTVDAICDQAGTSPATFYRYFGSKEAIIFDYEPDYLAGIEEMVGSLAKSPSVAVLAVAFAEVVTRDPEALALRDAIAVASPELFAGALAVQRRCEQALAAGLEREASMPPGAAAVMAAAVILTMRLGLRRWAEQPKRERRPLPELVRAVQGELHTVLDAGPAG